MSEPGGGHGSVTTPLPGTDEFDQHRVAERRAAALARRPRQIVTGVALVVAGLALAFGYTWAGIRPGQGSRMPTSPGFAGWPLLVNVAVVVVACGLVVAGTRCAVTSEGRRSRGWIGSALVVAVFATVFAGGVALAPVKWARATHPDAAAARELQAKVVTSPLAPYCTAPIDPDAFTAWVDDPEVCGTFVPGFPRELLIRGRAAGPTPVSGDVERGLIYAPDRAPDPWDTCIRQLDDVWWEYSSLVDGSSCPSGLTFIPGG